MLLRVLRLLADGVDELAVAAREFEPRLLVDQRRDVELRQDRVHLSRDGLELRLVEVLDVDLFDLGQGVGAADEGDFIAEGDRAHPDQLVGLRLLGPLEGRAPSNERVAADEAPAGRQGLAAIGADLFPRLGRGLTIRAWRHWLVPPESPQ